MLEVLRFMFRFTMGVLSDKGGAAGGGDGLSCRARGGGADTAAAASAGGGKGGGEVSEMSPEEMSLAPPMTRISAGGWAPSAAEGLVGSGLCRYLV